MIKITDSQLNDGLIMAQSLSRCPNSLSCLWAKISDSCDIREECELVLFRKALENSSPAFYGKFKELSEYDTIIQDLATMEVEGDPAQKNEARARFRDLNIFAQLSMVALYPLFEASDPPSITAKEIEEMERNHDDYDFLQINSNWFNWIGIFISNFHFSDKQAETITLLIRLYLNKNLPVRALSSEEEKERLFSEIAAHLKRLTKS